MEIVYVDIDGMRLITIFSRLKVGIFKYKRNWYTNPMYKECNWYIDPKI